MVRRWIAGAAICAMLAFPGFAAAGVPVYDTSTVVGQVPGDKCCVSQVAVADFNGDGLQDAIFTGSPPVTQNARELVVAELNADGRPDVFVGDHGDYQRDRQGSQHVQASRKIVLKR